MILTDTLKADLYRYSGRIDFMSFLKIMRNPGFRFTFIFRKLKTTSFFNPFRFVLKILYSKYSFKYGYQIPLTVKIGKGLMLPHFGGIVVNSKTVIGNNCNILQGVTLGNTKRGKNMGAPTIGDKVYIGPNAVVVGGIFIGDNVLIAPNSFVNINIPSNSIFVSGKIINKDDATEGYLLNILTSN